MAQRFFERLAAGIEICQGNKDDEFWTILLDG